MNILAIGAHPDDLEYFCGGTLALYAKAGHRVVMAVATSGNVGSPTLSSEEIAKVRHGEQKASCSLIGAELVWMGFDDEWLFDDRPTRAKFIDAIRYAKPDVMFVHSQNDYHPDHRNAGKIAEDARIPSNVRLVVTELPATEKIPHVFQMDNITGEGFVPEVYVDVTSTMEVKRKMLLSHQSQVAWSAKMYPDMQFDGQMLAQARARGIAAGCEYAEAFRVLKTFPRTGGSHLLPNSI